MADRSNLVHGPMDRIICRRVHPALGGHQRVPGSDGEPDFYWERQVNSA